MKAYLYAAGILLQFFTVLPFHRTLPMDQTKLRAVLHLFPAFGLVKGLIYAAAVWSLLEWSPFSPLAAAFFIWLLPIVFTGGLHLDGWMDWADAHFSFRDQEKRHEILKDPRTGAFGVLALLLLLAAKFLFIYETLQVGSRFVPFIGLIPFFAHITTGLFLQYVPAAKPSGLAFFFQKGRSRHLPVLYMAFFLCIAAFFALSPLFWVMTGASWLFFVFIQNGMKKEFGGLTGDLLGAAQEGAEALLWMILWLSVYFGTGSQMPM